MCKMDTISAEDSNPRVNARRGDFVVPIQVAFPLATTGQLHMYLGKQINLLASDLTQS